MVNHKSSEENLEVHRWRVIYIDNKMGKTQATLLTFIYLIPGDIAFTTFNQVSSSMYATLFEITQDNSGDPCADILRVRDRKSVGY